MELTPLPWLGTGLKRPECALCTRDGRTHVSNWDGGVTLIHGDGSQQELLAREPGFELKPNGICLLPDNSYLLAHLGAEDGGVFRLDHQGNLEPFLLEVDGQALPPSNYVHRDEQGRIWITVSTRLIPRALGYNPSVADGFVVLADKAGARVVADNLGYTNECLVHPDGKRLFVNETFARRLSSFDIAADGSLGNKTTVAEFGPGTFPDGLTFDCEGGVWITSIVSNRVIRIDPEGRQVVMLEDCDPEKLLEIEEAFQNGTMGRPHLDIPHGRQLKNISSLAFGGADLQSITLGCLLDDRLPQFRSPVAGYPPSHWNITSGN